MNNKMLERWKLKTKGIFHKITYDEFWFYIDDLMKENKKLTNNWNELEEWLKEDNPNVYCCSKSSQKAFEGAKAMYKIIILNKMKEIKEKNNEK